MLCAGVVRYALGCLRGLNLDAAQKEYKPPPLLQPQTVKVLLEYWIANYTLVLLLVPLNGFVCLFVSVLECIFLLQFI